MGREEGGGRRPRPHCRRFRKAAFVGAARWKEKKTMGRFLFGQRKEGVGPLLALQSPSAMSDGGEKRERDEAAAVAGAVEVILRISEQR